MLVPTAHFYPVEFACHSGEPYPEAWQDRWTALSGLCEAIREAWDAPLRVVSGYRTAAYNASLLAEGHHPASQSWHIQGYAADLKPVRAAAPGEDLVLHLHDMILRVYEAGNLPSLGGLGLYGPTAWTHVDLGHAPDGHLRRWSLR